METKIAQDSERIARALSVFEQALDQDDRRRAAWIEQACAGDAKLMEEVLSNLAAHCQSEQFLNVAQMPTQTIGPYRLLHSIGRGGMGEVYLAERADGAYDQKVAVKLIHAQLLSPELRARALG
jgi:eukaryotic-like serine/threonine-protein kinase